jgi:hypothetical protein
VRRVLASAAIGELRYSIEEPSALDRYVVDFVAETLGLVPVEAAGPADGPILYWGRRAREPSAKPRPGPRSSNVGGIWVPRREGDTIWADLLDGRLDPDAVSPEVPFDVLGAIGRLLTDQVHDGVSADGRDAHGRLRFVASLQARQGYGDVPIVNCYVDLLRSLVRRQLGQAGQPLWPPGKRAAVGLSHDVDRPCKWGLLRALSHGQWPRGGRRLAWFLGKAGKIALDRMRAGGRDDFWLFEPIMAAERQRGFRSTFMFAPTPSFGRGGTRWDVDYDIDWSRFEPIFRAIADGGFEVGLHAGYSACSDGRRFVDERRRLADRSGAAVTGLRHHFWHLGSDEGRTLRMHEEAGFAYDSSIAFNDELGFRRSVALPFRPWDPTLGRSLRTLQLPTFCMDGNLFHRRPEPGLAIERVAGFLDRIKTHGGLGVLDWHVRTSLPANREFRDWGKTYLGILDLLAADPELWVTGLGEIETWLEARRATLREARPSAGAAPSTSPAEPFGMRE